MEPIKNVVFATDFSKASENAKEFAVKLSKQLNVPLEVLHVFDGRMMKVPSPYYLMDDADTWIESYAAKSQKRGEEALDKLVKELDGYRQHFVRGKANEKIVNFCKEHDVGILVMGTHGYTGVDRLIMGSVAQHVVRNATCPVTTIKSSPN